MDLTAIVILVLATFVVLGVIAGSLATLNAERAAGQSCDCAWCHRKRDAVLTSDRSASGVRGGD